MHQDPLESARAKLARANDNLTQLQGRIHDDGQNKAFGSTFIHESGPDELVLKALMPKDLFIHYSIVAGEVVHHARSALDHAIWQMVPAPTLGLTGFPVLRNRSD